MADDFGDINIPVQRKGMLVGEGVLRGLLVNELCRCGIGCEKQSRCEGCACVQESK